MVKNTILYGKNFCAIEHSVNKKGDEIFHCLQLTQNKSELTINKSNFFYDLEEVLSFLKENSQKHIVLVINNQQVLFKSIKKEQDRTVQTAFSTLSLKDFYTETHHTENESYAAVVRKDYIDKLNENYLKAGVYVLDFVLGNFPVLGLIDVLPSDEEIYTSNAKIIIQNSKIKSIQNKQFVDETYVVNELRLKNSELLCLGAIINFYLKKETQQNRNNAQEYIYKTVFTKGYKVALGCIFIVLLLNFLLFSSYYNKIEKLNGYLSIYGDSKSELKMLSENLKKKKKLLEQIQNLSYNNLSKYVDQLVENIPETIVLNEVNYQPFIGTIKEDKKINSLIKTLNVEGEFKSNTELSSWIDSLEKREWIEKVEKLSIERNDKKKISTFYITIKIR